MADALLATFKAKLEIEADDSSQDAALDGFLTGARVQLGAYCGRTFTPATATRYFDAPSPPPDPWPWPTNTDPMPGSVLAVPDLVSVATLTAFGQALTEGPDFMLLTYVQTNGLPDHTYLLRMANGRPVPWVYNVPIPWQPLRAIAITGLYGVAEPGDITQAILMLAIRQRTADLRKYQGASGNAQQGGAVGDGPIFNQDIRDKCEPYKVTARRAVFA